MWHGEAKNRCASVADSRGWWVRLLPPSLAQIFSSKSSLFQYKRRTVRCVHLWKMTTRLIHCLLPSPFQHFWIRHWPPLNWVSLCVTCRPIYWRPETNIHQQDMHMYRHSHRIDCHGVIYPVALAHWLGHRFTQRDMSNCSCSNVDWVRMAKKHFSAIGDHVLFQNAYADVTLTWPLTCHNTISL